MTTVRQWYLTHLDAVDYDTSDAIDNLVDDIPNAPEGEHEVIDRAGVTARLASHAKAVKVSVKGEERADTIPMFQSLWVEGRRVRMGLLRLNFEQTVAVAEAARERADQAEIDATFLEHNVELYAKHPMLPNLQAVFDAESVQYEIVTHEQAM